jgi:hypothetical protein
VKSCRAHVGQVAPLVDDQDIVLEDEALDDGLLVLTEVADVNLSIAGN